MRRLVLTLALLAMVATGCRADDPVIETSGTSTTVRTGLELRVEVRGGAVVGGAAVEEVAAGRPIRFAITSDVADALVVTGTPAQDGTYQLAAGAPFTLDALAAEPGVIEAKLDRQQLTVATITVT